MKKLFIAALMIITVTTSAFAADLTRVNASVQKNFTFEYAEAKDVKWTVTAEFAKASFNNNGEKMEVFYQHNGEVIGTSKKVSLDVVPVSAKRAFAKRFNDYTIKEAIRFDGTEEDAYFISAENDSHSIILKVTDAGTSIFKKTAKK